MEESGDRKGQNTLRTVEELVSYFVLQSEAGSFRPHRGVQS